MYQREVNICLFLIGAELLGTLIFLCGFFPPSMSPARPATVEELPSKLEVSKFEVQRLYKARTQKVVIMVIDALRYDFVDERMQFTAKSLMKGSACLVKTKAHPPTVTLPRIKALMSGTLPNFMDVVMNFGSGEMAHDNIVDQAVRKGLRVVFYGDDTWIKLFPKKFARSEGTSSFFVSDFTEVDLNVTRNLERELGRKDWDVMILHYLGLDHIGHLEGPSSPKVGPKLGEMDLIVSKIYRKLVSMENQGMGRGVLIVCGDHGMKDTGGHGGTSAPELSVPAVIFNHFSHCDKVLPDMNQIDMVPFISFILGTPIPGNNIGLLNHRMIERFDSYTVLYALHYNTQQMANLFIRQYKEEGLTFDGFKYYLNAANLFDKWIQSKFLNQYNVSALWHYMRAQEQMSQILVRDRANFDMYAMVIAVILFFKVFVINLFRDVYQRLFDNLLFFSIIVLVLVFVNYLNCAHIPFKTFFCGHSPIPMFLILLTAVVLSACGNFIFYSPFRVKLPSGRNPFLFVGIVMHTISVASSSMIEEEHQVWYFIFVTYCLYLLPYNFKKVVPILWIHRVLRKLNQTGDQWATLPDIGDWLNLPENKSLLSGIYLMSLASTFLCCIYSQISLHMSLIVKFVNNFLITGTIFCVCCYRLAVGSVSFPGLDYPLSKGVFEAQLFWFFILVTLAANTLFQINRKKLFKKGSSIQHVSGLLFNVVYLTCCLLYRPHNCVLLPALFLFSCVIMACMQDVEEMTVLHYWLGKVFYFYQGNSNSLANIDIAVGYIGLTEYNIFTTGSYIVIHTFAAPLLSYILLIRYLLNSGLYFKERIKVYRTYLFLLSLELLFYSILVIFQRHHLFVWSVFSPKLLYLSAHLALYGFLILCTETVTFLNRIVSM